MATKVNWLKLAKRTGKALQIRCVRAFANLLQEYQLSRGEELNTAQQQKNEEFPNIQELLL